MAKSQALRIDRDTYDKATELANALGCTPREVLGVATEFYGGALCFVGEGLAVGEVIDASAKGLTDAFAQRVARMTAEGGADPLAVAMAGDLPVPTDPRELQAFAVRTLARILEATHAAGMHPREPAAMTPDDVLGRFAAACQRLAMIAATADKPTLVTEA